MQIEVKNINYTYSEGMPFATKAVSDVSFVVPHGDFAAIIGHTGSGKTTLVQLLAGLLKPSSGEVFADFKKVGIVFQYPEYQLFEENVLKDVCFGPKNLGLSEEECIKRAKYALKLVGLDSEEKGNQSPFNLSGGEKRRVAIAGVLAMRPEVLILDEPAAGLDPKGHNEILEMISRIRREYQMTTIIVSHNMDDVASLASHVLVIDKGRLVMDASPKEVFSREKELKDMGLGLPSCTEFLHRLKEKGMDVPCDAINFDETASVILDYLK